MTLLIRGNAELHLLVFNSLFVSVYHIKSFLINSTELSVYSPKPTYPQPNVGLIVYIWLRINIT